MKAGAVPLPVPGLGVPEEDGKPVSAADLAGDLGRASELIGKLGDILVGDMDLVMRHGDALQNLDIAKQVIVAVQMCLANQARGPADAARLCGLRRSAEQALLKDAKAGGPATCRTQVAAGRGRLSLTIRTSSPVLTASNSLAANFVGTPTQPCVAKPQRTLLPWIETPSVVSLNV